MTTQTEFFSWTSCCCVRLWFCSVCSRSSHSKRALCSKSSMRSSLVLSVECISVCHDAVSRALSSRVNPGVTLRFAFVRCSTDRIIVAWIQLRCCARIYDCANRTASFLGRPKRPAYGAAHIARAVLGADSMHTRRAVAGYVASYLAWFAVLISITNFQKRAPQSQQSTISRRITGRMRSSASGGYLAYMHVRLARVCGADIKL